MYICIYYFLYLIKKLIYKNLQNNKSTKYNNKKT